VRIIHLLSGEALLGRNIYYGGKDSYLLFYLASPV